MRIETAIKENLQGRREAMNVLIKGMEMPENCYDCLLQGSRGVCLVTGKEVESKQFDCRPEWCPIVPAVPLEDYQSMERTVVKLTKALNTEPKRGEWLIDISGLLMCSKCGTFLDEFQKPSRFCPNCGADMQSTMGQVKRRDTVNEGNTEKTIKGLADKICELINQPYFSKLAKACNIVVCDLCENADQCKDKPLPPGVQCLGWEPIGGCKK